jgi:hypothetical protein
MKSEIRVDVLLLMLRDHADDLTSAANSGQLPG